MAEERLNDGFRIFTQQKSTCLLKVDLSRKGSVDEPILNLIQSINGHERYFTTSSCSGRICAFEEPEVVTNLLLETGRV